MPKSFKPRPELLETCSDLESQIAAWKDIAEEHLTPRYIELVEYYVREFFNIIEKPLKNIKDSDGDRYIKTMKNRIATSTVVNTLRQVQGFIRFFGVDPKFDFPRLKNKREEDIRRQLISREELDKFLEFAADTRDRAMFTILFECGLRVSELVGLRWKDVDFRKWTLQVTRKGGFRQELPFGDLSIATLTELKNRGMFTEPDDFLFLSIVPRKWGEQLGRRGVRERVHTIGKRAGLRDEQCHPHAFRHSCATYLLAQGLNLRQVQHILGHNDIKTTAIYAHILESDVTSDYAKIMRKDSGFGVAEGEVAGKPLERCPQCDGSRLPYHRVCPGCGYDYTGEYEQKLREEIQEEMRGEVKQLIKDFGKTLEEYWNPRIERLLQQEAEAKKYLEETKGMSLEEQNRYFYEKLSDPEVVKNQGIKRALMKQQIELLENPTREFVQLADQEAQAFLKELQELQKSGKQEKKKKAEKKKENP